MNKPELLAPAGDTACLLAAAAAGADAAYLGLKHFSARMQADNFSISELARLADLCRSKGMRLYVAMNTLLKPGDAQAAGRLIDRLARAVRPDALIVQDLGMPELIRQSGYPGEIHLSTLANLSHPASLRAAKALGASRVIVPRELSVDEIKAMDAACPEGLDLEAFVHGALCYCVSGRCYWSSYMGGKSGLRGRCVQPCRRVYRQGKSQGRFFSCLDLSLDVLAKTLLAAPRMRAWKIEGRKKGPHYVYYATTAYRLLRDHPDDPAVKKEAMDILSMTLGRPGSHYFFLPQRPMNPTGPDQETGSGLLVSRIGKPQQGSVSIKPRLDLLPGDLLRIGSEDEAWHCTEQIRRRVPKGGSHALKLAGGPAPRPGTPVFLIDRREPELTRLIQSLERELAAVHAPDSPASAFAPSLPPPLKKRPPVQDMTVRGSLSKGRTEDSPKAALALWLSPKSAQTTPRTLAQRIWWWLPPVVWPDEEDQWRELLARTIRSGARRFVCNAPWQTQLFEDPGRLELMAGPFCNTANPLALDALRRLGFSAAVASPELAREDFLALAAASPLPLGVVIQGDFPMGVSRIPPEGARAKDPLASPKNEVFWIKRYGQNTWVYPNWPLDLTPHRKELEQAGYVWFLRMEESPPSSAPRAARHSSFNWDLTLL